jgi:hypothetical protein
LQRHKVVLQNFWGYYLFLLVYQLFQRCLWLSGDQTRTPLVAVQWSVLRISWRFHCFEAAFVSWTWQRWKRGHQPVCYLSMVTLHSVSATCFSYYYLGVADWQEGVISVSNFSDRIHR